MTEKITITIGGSAHRRKHVMRRLILFLWGDGANVTGDDGFQYMSASDIESASRKLTGVNVHFAMDASEDVTEKVPVYQADTCCDLR